jgi:hypothetical protein
MELVKLTNTGSSSITFAGDEPVVLAAGTTRIVPWQFATDYLGRPNVDNANERATEYGLIRAMWGFHDGFDSAAVWEEKRPKVETYTIEGDRIFMLIEDPHRRQTNPNVDGSMSTDDSDAAVLRAALAEQADRMARLEAQLAALTAPAIPDVSDQQPQTVQGAQTENAVATTTTPASSSADVSELPSPKPTPANATDRPKR